MSVPQVLINGSRPHANSAAQSAPAPRPGLLEVPTHGRAQSSFSSAPRSTVTSVFGEDLATRSMFGGGYALPGSMTGGSTPRNRPYGISDAYSIPEHDVSYLPESTTASVPSTPPQIAVKSPGRGSTGRLLGAGFAIDPATAVSTPCSFEANRPSVQSSSSPRAGACSFDSQRASVQSNYPAAPWASSGAYALPEGIAVQMDITAHSRDVTLPAGGFVPASSIAPVSTASTPLAGGYQIPDPHYNLPAFQGYSMPERTSVQMDLSDMRRPDDQRKITPNRPSTFDDNLQDLE